MNFQKFIFRSIQATKGEGGGGNLFEFPKMHFLRVMRDSWVGKGAMDHFELSKMHFYEYRDSTGKDRFEFSKVHFYEY